MWNIKALALSVQKLLARLKFQRGGQHDRMTDRTKTICPTIFDLGGIKTKHVQNEQWAKFKNKILVPTPRILSRWYWIRWAMWYCLGPFSYRNRALFMGLSRLASSTSNLAPTVEDSMNLSRPLCLTMRDIFTFNFQLSSDTPNIGRRKITINHGHYLVIKTIFKYKSTTNVQKTDFHPCICISNIHYFS